MPQSKKDIRKHFHAVCFHRDRYRCAFCKTQLFIEYDVHHITNRKEMPNGGYVKENGITLCPPCHLKAEKFHISKGYSWEPNMHPNDLYKLIGSTYELAVEKSKSL